MSSVQEREEQLMQRRSSRETRNKPSASQSLNIETLPSQDLTAAVIIIFCVVTANSTTAFGLFSGDHTRLGRFHISCTSYTELFGIYGARIFVDWMPFLSPENSVTALLFLIYLYLPTKYLQFLLHNLQRLLLSNFIVYVCCCSVSVLFSFFFHFLINILISSYVVAAWHNG